MRKQTLRKIAPGLIILAVTAGVFLPPASRAAAQTSSPATQPAVDKKRPSTLFTPPTDWKVNEKNWNGGVCYDITRENPLTVVHNSPLAPGPRDRTLCIRVIVGKKITQAELAEMQAFNEALWKKFAAKNNDGTLARIAPLDWWETRDENNPDHQHRRYLLPTHFNKTHSVRIECRPLTSRRYAFKVKADAADARRALAAVSAAFTPYNDKNTPASQPTSQPAQAGIKDQWKHAPLRSTCRIGKYVFASNPYGVFRLNPKTRQWVKLETPKEMAPNGSFAKAPANQNTLLYATPLGAKGKPGVYRSDDLGKTWTMLLAGKDYYGPMLILGNGTLFVAKNAFNMGGRPGLTMSKDNGKTWRDITGKNLPGICGLFPDPDHPGQVCVRAHCLRGYVLQADDERYQWKWIREWDWKPETRNPFNDERYSTQTTLYLLYATLDNYFQHNWKNRVFLPSLFISPDRPVIEKTQGRPIEINATVRFQEDMNLRKWYQQENRRKGEAVKPVEPTVVKLIDQTTSTGLWGVAVEFAGKTTFHSSACSKLIYEAQDRDKARKKILAEPGWKDIALSMSQPYQRTLNLSDLADFSKPGTYKVRLLYNNTFIAIPHQKGYWVGTFSSNPFTVVVKGTTPASQPASQPATE